MRDAGIYIPSLSFSLSHSANSNVSNDSSVGTNTVSGSASSTSEITFSVSGLKELSVQSGSCSYTLKDSTGILANKTGTLTSSLVVNISGYNIITLTSSLNDSRNNVGTHNSNCSGSNSSSITGLRIE